MFRHRKISSIHPTPRFVKHRVLHNFVKDGVTYSRLVSVPVDGSKIPNPSDYLLHDLLEAGVPLNVVSSQIVDNVPSSEQVDKIVNNIVESDNCK